MSKGKPEDSEGLQKQNKAFLPSCVCLKGRTWGQTCMVTLLINLCVREGFRAERGEDDLSLECPLASDSGASD